LSGRRPRAAFDRFVVAQDDVAGAVQNIDHLMLGFVAVRRRLAARLDHAKIHFEGATKFLVNQTDIDRSFMPRRNIGGHLGFLLNQRILLGFSHEKGLSCAFRRRFNRNPGQHKISRSDGIKAQKIIDLTAN
jgi:hypothetical protein